MRFSDITQAFDASTPGSDAFLAVKTGAQALIGADPANAAAYFLIYGYARNYVILHDDEPITLAYAQASKQQLLGYMRQLEAALPLGPAALLQAMSAIVSDYLKSSKPF